jgi:hypothetical protein
MAQLIDCSKGGRVIKSSSLEDSDLVNSLRRGINSRSFDKVVRVVDESIASVASKGNSSLVWGCVGSMFGDTSNTLGHGDAEYLWDKVIGIMGDDRLCMMTVGTLLMWRVAVRAEETEERWIATKTEFEDFDEVTGKRITRYEYFIAK